MCMQTKTTEKEMQWKREKLGWCSHHVTHVVHAQVIWMQAHGGLQVVKGDKFKVSLPQLPPAQVFILPI